MKKSSRLIFFGTENFSAPTLEKLLSESYNVVAIITKPDSPSGRGQKISAPKVKEIGLEHGIKVLQPEKLTDISTDIMDLKPTHGVLVAYGKIIPQATINLFPGGIINVHPSLLPKYRGPAPIENAILNGDRETGISIMSLSASMDEGPVYYEEHIKLTGNEDRLRLYKELSETGAKLLVDKLESIIQSTLAAQPQTNSQATYTKLLKKSDSLMDFEAKSAEQLEREVRAYLGFPRSRAEIDGREMVVTKARVAKDAKDGDLVVPTRDGYLEIQELIASSGRHMTGADYTRGYRKS